MRAPLIALVAALAFPVAAHTAVVGEEPPPGPALATVDLATADGLALVRGAWRYHDTRIVEVTHRAPDRDGQPTGAPIQTWDYTPRAGAADFDDAQWPIIDPRTLAARRGSGRLCFNWYRLRVTIPERVGSFDPTGTTAVFETTLDDYAEIWIDGELGRALGQPGGSVVKGWNAPNRVVIGRDVTPGQQIQLAVFGINGPLSDPPANFIWMRSAKLEFLPADGGGPQAIPPREVNVEVVRLDPAIDALVPENPKLYKLAEGFQFTEGPVWVRDGGYLLFSDPNANTIYRYTAGGELSVFRAQSGYSGADVAEYRQPGSNGITLDRDGRVVFDQHGNRQVVRLERDGSLTVLASRYDGKRLNSPNDLVHRSDGTLFFTDPPFGLPRVFDDPRKDLPFSGVYALRDGELRLVSSELTGPNGIAFSPDERWLYVGNWDAARKVVMRFAVGADGAATEGTVFFDMTPAPGADAIDGIKVDQQGNLYVSGPGGLWVLSPAGRHLGTIRTPRHAHNLAWGDADGRALYLTAQSVLYRMPLKVGGARR
jgi:gluconolactonase